MNTTREAILVRIRPIAEEATKFHLGCQGGGIHSEVPGQWVECLEDDDWQETLDQDEHSLTSAELDVYVNAVHAAAYYLEGTSREEAIEDMEDDPEWVWNQPQMIGLLTHVRLLEEMIEGIETQFDRDNADNFQQSLIAAEAIAVATMRMVARASEIR